MKIKGVLFFVFISIIGNLVAEYALLWQGLGLDLGIREIGLLESKVSLYFLGQALGFVLLSPVLGWLFDKLPKKQASILIDAMYATSFVLCWLLLKLQILDSWGYLVFSLIFSSLGALYRNAVLFSIFKELAKKHDIQIVLSHFAYIFSLTIAFGMGFSGLIVHFAGMEMALLIGVVTFAPMPFVYNFVFQKAQATGSKKSTRSDILYGFRKIISDHNLLGVCISIFFANFSASILPGLIGLVILKSLPQLKGNESILVASVIALSTILIPLLQRLSLHYKLKTLNLIAFVPPGIAFLSSTVISRPEAYLLSYFIALGGITLANIVAGSIRVKVSEPDSLGLINTTFFSLISIGQIVGSIFIMPLALKSIKFASLAVGLSYLFASLAGYFLIKNEHLKDLKDA